MSRRSAETVPTTSASGKMIASEIRQHDGGSFQPEPDQVGDGLSVGDGNAEVERRCSRDPVSVAHGDRPVEAVPGAELGDCGRVGGCVSAEVGGDRVAGKQVYRDEDEGGCGEKGDDSDNESLRDYPEHRLPSRRTNPLASST